MPFACLRSPSTSVVSAYPGVRAFLLEMQRDLARTRSVIMDGRDIGTVVLPRPQSKFILTADAEARAQRRSCGNCGEKGDGRPSDEVLRTCRSRTRTTPTERSRPPAGG